MRKPMTLLYDSLCPVCSREVRLLKRFDRARKLTLVDIAAPDFDPARYDLTLEQCVGSLRGIDAEGRPLDGMATIRAMYSAVGLGPLMGWTTWPGARQLSDLAYRVFAHFRPRFSRFDPSQCASDRCRPKGAVHAKP